MRHTINFLFLASQMLAVPCCTVPRGESSSIDVAHRKASDLALPGRHYVLTIGIDNYVHHAPLPSAEADANGMQTVLANQYGYIVLPPIRDATDVEITNALNRLKNFVKEGDRLLIYYSGHGAAGEAGTRGYWLPSNAGKTSPAGGDDQVTHWLSREFIADQLRNIRATEILIIDDSCFSGGGADTSHLVAAIGADGAKPVAMPAVAADCAHADWRPPKRTVRWLSAARDEAAGGTGAQQRSLFTKYLLDILERNDNPLGSNELFERVREHMAAAPESQIPEYIEVSRANHQNGEFLFVPKTWSVDALELRMGTVTVRAHTVDPARDNIIQQIVEDEMRNADAKSRPIRPDNRARPLCLSLAFEKGNQLVMTMVDRANDKLMASVTQALGTDAEDGERIGNDIHAAVLNLHNRAVAELHGEEISVDIVRKALIAERTQSWGLSLAFGRQAYLDFDGKGLLKDAGYSMRAAIDLNVTSWLLLAPVLGFDMVSSQSSRSSFIGDLGSGTYANNTLKGTTTLVSGIAMGRATVRIPHGLILPFGYASIGVAYFVPHLSDEYEVPLTSSDTLPLNIINARSANSSAALVWEAGAGVAYRWTERLSVLAEAQFFQAYHNIVVTSEIQGFHEQKPLVSPFEGIHGVSIRMGVGVHY